MKNAPKIAINIDIRGFSEDTTPGKNTFLSILQIIITTTLMRLIQR